ncbi:MAG TPA: hypothetical protein PLQ76_09490, partial [bacterium]|nr:hypothetical protein [bacterium]
PLSDHVDTAEGAEEFMAAILRAIEGRTKTSPDERRAVARANTWKDRAAKITEIIDSAIEQRRI